ncbi:UPF0057-domain-containing protein [Dissoconium aciculare CBS 342.82]|jgi:uncharacterized membrane protein YqaE (UPF0057 family)|uniref:UPF0057-domain-containing protein n=1 Tax=Dissoconium aciculare CBS 342.82 TaxID=1314786 RepID=A0A6J3MIP0_9PEZI|nr:UPF0057-domain-containing protein [Dissoconium aciculare CBS 342.82]KAF1827569.1 UPF0057-domain-containing protein [Dissoconium aciculare CBS 342.82]
MARQSSSSDVLLYLLAVFVPPVPVALKAGCGADLIINIVFTLFAWIPGVVHAWWVISKYDPAKHAPRY